LLGCVLFALPMCLVSGRGFVAALQVLYNGVSIGERLIYS